MEATEHVAAHVCPACGGAGGGPFGPAGSAWDDEEYVCVRCKGRGMIAVGEPMRPGVVKASTPPAAAPPATGTHGGPTKR